MSRVGADKNEHALVNGSMAASVSSSPICIADYDHVGLQVTHTGDAVGTLAVHGSISCGDDGTGGSYVPLNEIVDIANPAGTALDQIINLSNLSVPWVKVVFTFASSAGSAGLLNVWACKKGARR